MARTITGMDTGACFVVAGTVGVNGAVEGTDV